MHKIALERKELYQLWAYGSKTVVESPVLKCCDQADTRLDSKELYQGSNPFSLPVRLSRVVNNIAFPGETVKQSIGG